MIRSLFRKLLGTERKSSEGGPVQSVEKLMSDAFAKRQQGDLSGAIALYKAVLLLEPSNAQATNDLGVCYSDRGDIVQAQGYFERAYALDDSYLPAIVNHAKTLNDKKQSEEAVEVLEHAVLSDPGFGHTYMVYAGVCHARGWSESAALFHKRAWMDNFDNLRAANGYLFHGSYADEDELHLAAEHVFWAKTLPPSLQEGSQQAMLERARGASIGKRKVRIGYWSPDFRDHSVRFFFQPLLESHDRQRVETYLYHDCSVSDHATDAIRALAHEFRDVYALSDKELSDVLLRDELDVLVELAGHTSNNRVAMLTGRYAPVQISALGYPPTTGLSQIDYKLIDVHLWHKDIGRYMSEKPMVLPESFWCFRPYAECSLDGDARTPQESHFTFGCVGNISKISDVALSLWARILTQVPNARLLLRSISFEDPAAMSTMLARMGRFGVPTDRVVLKGPEAGVRFMEAYRELDVVLDTFPFCGGTTTCFATYMGVPVVTLPGASVVSRMGLSNLTALGFPELVARTPDEYVAVAVRLAGDLAYLREFRAAVRSRYESCALGNSEMFASHFEEACRGALSDVAENGWRPPEVTPPALDEAELMQRAYAVASSGQSDAARRIARHCLDAYPDSVAARIFFAEEVRRSDGDAGALRHLEDALPDVVRKQSSLALLYGAGLHISQGDFAAARSLVGQVKSLEMKLTRSEALELELYRGILDQEHAGALASTPAQEPKQWVCLVVTSRKDAAARVAEVKAWPGLSAERIEQWLACDYVSRDEAYSSLVFGGRADRLLVVHDAIAGVGDDLLSRCEAWMTAGYAVVGFVGCKEWSTPDWRREDWKLQSGGFCVPDPSYSNTVWVNYFGAQRDRSGPLLRVLDGALLAVDCTHEGIDAVTMDADLDQAGTLMEEDWVYRLAEQGTGLIADCGLSVVLDDEVQSSDRQQRLGGMLALHEKRRFELFNASLPSQGGVRARVPLNVAMNALRRLSGVSTHE